MEVASVPGAGQHATITISEIECGGSRSVNYLEWAFPFCLETSRVGNDLFHDPTSSANCFYLSRPEPGSGRGAERS